MTVPLVCDLDPDELDEMPQRPTGHTHEGHVYQVPVGEAFTLCGGGIGRARIMLPLDADVAVYAVGFTRVHECSECDLRHIAQPDRADAEPMLARSPTHAIAWLRHFRALDDGYPDGRLLSDLRGLDDGDPMVHGVFRPLCKPTCPAWCDDHPDPWVPWDKDQFGGVTIADPDGGLHPPGSLDHPRTGAWHILTDHGTEGAIISAFLGLDLGIPPGDRAEKLGIERILSELRRAGEHLAPPVSASDVRSTGAWEPKPTKRTVQKHSKP